MIAVIASSSLLPPFKLGWDPGMELYNYVSKTPCPSYNHKFSIAEIQGDVYKTRWVITLPGEGGGSAPPEKFVTIRALSCARAEVMCGRATLVWEVVKLSELLNPKTVGVELALA